MTKAAFEVRARPVPGTPYMRYQIIVDKQVIRSKIGPFDPAEAEEIVLAHQAGVSATAAISKPNWGAAAPFGQRVIIPLKGNKSATEKYCGRGKHMVPISHFASDGVKPQNWCRDCHSDYQRKHKKLRGEKIERAQRP